MKEFYLWLQNEVKCLDLNTCLYLSNLNQFKEPKMILEKIEKVAHSIARQFKNGEYRDDSLSVSVEDLKNSKVHASFNPNTHEIVINKVWLDFLNRFLSPEQSMDFCRYHELTHTLEDHYFKEYKRKQRHQAHEVLAKRVSSLCVDTSYHPSIYEYKYGLECNHYTQEQLIHYLKGVLPCDL